MKKRVPRNTTREMNDNPLMGLAIAMNEGASGMIESQEAQGQQSFVNSTTLPTKIMTDKGKEILESFGVVFGDTVEGDPMFQHVTLPDGWTRAGTSHSMHSDVLDSKGRKRIGVFYKAAFYDRSAHMSLSRRYSTHQDYKRRDEEKIYVAIVADGYVAEKPHDTKIIYTTDPIPCPETGDDWDAYDKTNKDAKEWLDEHYPDWNDPAAYWDE